MIYRFNLEAVLRYRENIEKRHIHEMSELKSDLMEKEKKLSEYTRMAKDVAIDLAEKEKSGIRSGEASIYRAFLRDAKRRIRKQKKKIDALEDRIEKKLVELIEASKNKKIVESLKERQREKFFSELRRKNQKEMDDCAAKGYARRKRN